jgi:chromosome partitioning protein
MILSVVNQKGGTGKTTTTLHLSYLLAERGYSVLAIDLDPQAALTFAVGIDSDKLEKAIDTVIASYAFKRSHRTKLGEIIAEITIGDVKISVAPSRIDLDTLNITLGGVMGREKILSKILNDFDGADIVLIDCQPAMSLLTINALSASDYTLVPVETAYLPLRGLIQLMDMVNEIREEYNPDLEILGILPNKYDSRLVVSRDNLKKLKRFEKVCKVYPPVPYSTYFEKALRDRAPLRKYDFKTAKEALKTLEFVCEDIVKIVEGGA